MICTLCGSTTSPRIFLSYISNLHRSPGVTKPLTYETSNHQNPTINHGWNSVLFSFYWNNYIQSFSFTEIIQNHQTISFQSCNPASRTAAYKNGDLLFFNQKTLQDFVPFWSHLRWLNRKKNAFWGAVFFFSPTFSEAREKHRFPRGANWHPFRNHLAAKLEGPSYVYSAVCYIHW